MFCYLQVSIFFFIQAMFLGGFVVEVWHVYEKMKASGMVFKLLQ
jgi:pentatricopeptide repeat protein